MEVNGGAEVGEDAFYLMGEGGELNNMQQSDPRRARGESGM